MNKYTKKAVKILLAVMLLSIFSSYAYATDSIPPAATTPAECGTVAAEKDGKSVKMEPYNCLFLSEPIGGQASYDLYKKVCSADSVCEYKLWNGGSLAPGTEFGPYQAILTQDASKPEQGPFTLLYGYIRLIYLYMSGIIIGVSVLFIVIGGVQISLYGANQGSVDEGKKRITKAIIGLIVWFTSSLILYTINPTFFNYLT